MSSTLSTPPPPPEGKPFVHYYKEECYGKLEWRSGITRQCGITHTHTHTHTKKMPTLEKTPFMESRALEEDLNGTTVRMNAALLFSPSLSLSLSPTSPLSLEWWWISKVILHVVQWIRLSTNHTRRHYPDWLDQAADILDTANRFTVTGGGQKCHNSAVQNKISINSMTICLSCFLEVHSLLFYKWAFINHDSTNL